MVASEVADENLGIDWEHLLENLPDDLNFDFPDRPDGDRLSDAPDSGGCLSIDDIEQYLLNDESGFVEEGDRIDVEDAFFSDVLLDSLPESGSDRSKESSSSPESIEAGTEEENIEEDKSREDGGDAQQVEEKNGVSEDIDPDAKKRKRQLRNRDAAMRSRERKKSYVSDLEMKSKFYEAECKRLGILLQCCLAENQALKLSLHSAKAFDASMARQESAVLLLESLLLGSLLGFLGIICLLPLLSSHLQSAILSRNADRGERRSGAPRRAQSEVSYILFHHSYMMMGKICKASRTRMKEGKVRLSATEDVWSLSMVG